MSGSNTVKRLTVGIALLGTLVVGSTGLVLGQATEEAATVSHPAHIHNGTCDNLDPNPAAPLTSVEPNVNKDSDDEDANAPQGVLTATKVLYSKTEGAEIAWDDLLAESHAINVHESDENIQNYIACGDIGGVVVDDQLVIALHPQNDSGYTGIAIVKKNGDDKVDVEIYLSEPAGTTKATPVA